MAATPNDPFFNRQTYLTNVGMPDAWEFAKGSPVIKVAIFDSGVDLTHPDLKDRIWTNPGEFPGNGIDDDNNGFVDDVHGWDFVDNDADANPDIPANPSVEALHHGTVVAGIIAAAGSNGEGIAGVTWNGSIMPLRTLDENGIGTTDKLEDAIRYAIKAGAKIFNFSFNGEGFSDSLQETLRDAANRGIVIVSAAGNEGDTDKGGNLNVNPNWPVCFKNNQNQPLVIGVASLERNGRRSSFSSYGSNCIALSAPGESYFGTQVYRPGNPKLDEPYGNGWSGTSLAAPLVSGTAALIASMNPDFSPSQIRGFLTSTASDISAQNGAQTADLGAGKLDAAAAVRAAQQAILGQPVPSDTSYVSVLSPNGGETYLSDQAATMSWIWQGSRVQFVRLTYVPTVGDAFILRDMVAASLGSSPWVVPHVTGTATARIRIDALDAGGSILASDFSDGTFTIVASDGPVVGGYDYDPAAARTSATTIDADKGLTGSGHPNCPTGNRVKGPLSTIYYCGADGKRYVFTDSRSYLSWFPNFNGVRTISESDLASIPFGGAVTYRPGVRMIKLQTSPKTYVIARGGILRELPDEATARALYGPAWNTFIDDVSDAFFPIYKLGQPVRRTASQ